MFVTGPTLPKEVVRVTTSPVVVRLWPWASLAWTVTVDVDIPLAMIDVGLAEMVVVAADTGPATMV